MVSVIVVAAGNSERMDGVKKQFIHLNDIPVLVRSVAKFDELPQVSEIIVVVSPEDLNEAKQMMYRYGLRKVTQVVAGGATRQQSVAQGFAACDRSCSLIAIHDAARPFVRQQDILQVFADAQEYGAATLGAPVKDTVKQVKQSQIIRTPDRSKLYVVFTPQVFRMEWYTQGMTEAQRLGEDYVDDCQLIEKLGYPVHITIGSYTNIKITTPDDLIYAEVLAKEET